MIDVQEAAALVSRAPETVRRWVWSGRLAAQRSGRKIVVARDDVLRMTGVKPAPSDVSLAQWAAELRQDNERSGRASTASDLVLADRAGRSD